MLLVLFTPESALSLPFKPLSCVKNEALIELLHLLQDTAHGGGVVRTELVTRRVWFLPVQSCKHHALLLAEAECQAKSTQIIRHSVTVKL